jgi:hypothetical protein
MVMTLTVTIATTISVGSSCACAALRQQVCVTTSATAQLQLCHRNSDCKCIRNSVRNCNLAVLSQSAAGEAGGEVAEAFSELTGEISEQVATAAEALRALISSISSKVKVSLGFLQIFSNMTVRECDTPHSIISDSPIAFFYTIINTSIYSSSWRCSYDCVMALLCHASTSIRVAST